MLLSRSYVICALALLCPSLAFPVGEIAGQKRKAGEISGEESPVTRVRFGNMIWEGPDYLNSAEIKAIVYANASDQLHTLPRSWGNTETFRKIRGKSLVPGGVENYTLAHVAAVMNQWHVLCQFLLAPDFSADDFRDSFGNTPLHAAAMAGSPYTFVNLNNPYNPNWKNPNSLGKTPEQLAIEFGNERLLGFHRGPEIQKYLANLKLVPERWLPVDYRELTRFSLEGEKFSMRDLIQSKRIENGNHPYFRLPSDIRGLILEKLTDREQLNLRRASFRLSKETPAQDFSTLYFKRTVPGMKSITTLEQFNAHFRPLQLKYFSWGPDLTGSRDVALLSELNVEVILRVLQDAENLEKIELPTIVATHSDSSIQKFSENPEATCSGPMVSKLIPVVNFLANAKNLKTASLKNRYHYAACAYELFLKGIRLNRTIEDLTLPLSSYGELELLLPALNNKNVKKLSIYFSNHHSDPGRAWYEQVADKISQYKPLQHLEIVEEWGPPTYKPLNTDHKVFAQHVLQMILRLPKELSVHLKVREPHTIGGDKAYIQLQKNLNRARERFTFSYIEPSE
jgi:hypothetical protein